MLSLHGGSCWLLKILWRTMCTGWSMYEGHRNGRGTGRRYHPIHESVALMRAADMSTTVQRTLKGSKAQATYLSDWVGRYASTRTSLKGSTIVFEQLAARGQHFKATSLIFSPSHMSSVHHNRLSGEGYREFFSVSLYILCPGVAHIWAIIFSEIFHS